MSANSEAVQTEKIESMFNSDSVIVMNPHMELLQYLVGVIKNMDQPGGNIRIVADNDQFTDAMDDFVVGITLQELIENDIVSLFVGDVSEYSSFIASNETLMDFVRAGDTTEMIMSDDSEVRDELFNAANAQLSEYEEASPRYPSLTTFLSTLREDLGDEMADEVAAMIDLDPSEYGSFTDTDQVELMIQLAARHEKLLYDISKWGEDVGFASKATFSRTKRTLQEHGKIETEKVPIDVGRPRLRLKSTESTDTVTVSQEA